MNVCEEIETCATRLYDAKYVETTCGRLCK